MNEDLSGEHKDVGRSELPNVVDIVSAYVSNNSLRAADLPSLIGSVHMAIRQLGNSPVAVPDIPAVPVKKSLTKDYIICLEDGKKFKSLRRHLSSSYNMTPDEYRAKWNLPSDYPMVAPSYSAARSQLARDSGLGQIAASNPAKAVHAGKPREMEMVEPALETSEVVGAEDGPLVAKKGRGRPRKVV